MTRRASIIGLLLATALLVLGLQSWNVAVSLVENQIVARVEARAGFRITAFKRAEIALLPLPRINLSDVTFAHPDGTIVGKALKLRARARVLSMLAAQLDFDRVDLIGPEIDVAVAGEAESFTNWIAGPLDYLAKLQSDTQIVVSSGSIMVRSGNVILSTVRDVNLVIQDRTATDPIAIAGSLVWRGQGTRVDLLWPVAGVRAPVALSLASDLMSFRLNGTRSGGSESVTSGQIEFKTRSLADTLGWVGPKPRVATLAHQVSLSAEAQFAGSALSLNSVIVKLDGDQLEGALKVSSEASSWALSGTLAGADFDLGRLFRQAENPSVAGASAARRETPLEFDDWTTHDVDLRFSLDSARLGPAKLTDLAAQLMIRKGRFEASVLRAGAYGGVARARILATGIPGGADVKLQLGADRINLAQAASDLPELSRLSGIATGQLALDGLGESIEQVTRSFNGRGSLSVRQGEIRGLSFADLLRRSEKPQAAPRDWRQGKTAFETAQFNATASQGVLWLTEAQISGTGYVVNLSGNADIGRRWLELSGILAATNAPARIPFTLKGPVATATLMPDFEAPPLTR